MMGFFDPPDEPTISKWEAALEDSLPESLTDDEADAIRKIVSDLVAQLDRECAVCAKRANEAEREAERLGAEWQKQPLPEKFTCPHGADWLNCHACDVAGDLAYDAARERNFFRR